VVCPFDHASCKELVTAIEEAAKDASRMNSTTGPMAPAPYVVKAGDQKGLKLLGLTVQGGERKLLIE
jgi:hypothetical protein